MNSLHKFGVKGVGKSAAVVAVCAAVLAGCGPQDGQKEFAAAKTAYEVRDLAKADKLLAESLKFAADDVDILLYAARVKLELGELTAAREVWDKANALAAKDVDVQILGAQLKYHAKDYAAAKKVYAELAADEKLDKNVRAQALAELGVVECTEDNFDIARLAFLKAIRLDRRNAAARYHLGLLYRDGFGFNDAALEQFETFVRLEVVADARVQKVQRTLIPNLKEAIARQAAETPGAEKRDSAASAAALSKAEAALKKRDYKTAKKEYQKACEADVLSYPAALGLAEVWAKTDASTAGQKKTLEYYRKACALKASAVRTFVTTGDLAYKLGSYATAVDSYSRAVAANPSDLSAIDGLIRSLQKVGGRKKDAVAYQAYRDLVSAARKR
jgi:tetratricopeptide (TPR) repeat protein